LEEAYSTLAFKDEIGTHRKSRFGGRSISIMYEENKARKTGIPE
jgi:hypothetical protein